MRTMRLVRWLTFALTLVTMILSGRFALAQWGGRRCGPVRFAPMQPLQLNATGCCSTQCACGCNAGGECRCFPNRLTGAQPAADPFATDQAEALPDWKTRGVEWQPQAGPTRYEHNGREVSREAVIERLDSGGQLADDSTKVRLTVIGSAGHRKRVLQDLEAHPELAPLRSKLVVQAYDPADKMTGWAVSRYGFKTDGAPNIYAQEPGGQVMHRQDDYADGPEGLAVALAKVIGKRDADPNYTPAKDPDRRKPDLVPADWWQTLFGLAAAFLPPLLALFVPKRIFA